MGGQLLLETLVPLGLRAASPISASVTTGFSLPLCPNFPLMKTLASALGPPDSRVLEVRMRTHVLGATI